MSKESEREAYALAMLNFIIALTLISVIGLPYTCGCRRCIEEDAGE